ncbi:hypothetical protein [Gephyromycinifex aptenodytis]|uniref:hypothetical protein n=1 Tax=Gephyromycinifex aptenodytis TaxID=2716227 RepID=UPI0014450B00|nr:hypothetical protein [Gephyromycinifex aptenodytis]
MGVRVWLRDGRIEQYGRSGDKEWTARRDEYDATLLVAYLRAGQFEEVRRFYRGDEWSRVEIS